MLKQTCPRKNEKQLEFVASVRRRRIIIMATAANIGRLSAMTPTKNRAWPQQYEATKAYRMCYSGDLSDWSLSRRWSWYFRDYL